MYPLTHFLISFFIGLLLVSQGYFTYLQAFITGLVGLLIDVDHFVCYALKRSFNFKKAWNAAVLHKLKERTLVHHLPGFLVSTLILVILFFVSKVWFWILFIGYYSHMILDYINFGKWLRVKKKIKFEEEGFFFKVPLYEIVLEIILVLLIILVILV